MSHKKKLGEDKVQNTMNNSWFFGDSKKRTIRMNAIKNRRLNNEHPLCDNYTLIDYSVEK